MSTLAISSFFKCGLGLVGVGGGKMDGNLFFFWPKCVVSPPKLVSKYIGIVSGNKGRHVGDASGSRQFHRLTVGSLDQILVHLSVGIYL